MQPDALPPDEALDDAAVRSIADVARLLRELRRRSARQRGGPQLTYRELAAKTGWSRSLIALYFSGQSLPPTDRFDVLVQLLGATPAEQRAFATARDRVEESRYAKPSETGRPVPRALPAPPSHFVGREAELRTLDTSLAMQPEEAGVVVIEGTAGVGKTALALHWAHKAAPQFPDGHLYVNLRGFDQSGQVMSAGEALRCLLDALRVPAQQLPASLDAQAALYRTLLAGKRMLIVLDNARDAGQVRPLLPGISGCLIVITSRNQLSGLVAIEGARPIVLDLLTMTEATDLLTRRLGADRVGAELDAVQEIAIRCARLPLALVVVAARAAVRPTFRLDAVALELGNNHRPRPAFTVGDVASDVDAVFSWSYQALSSAGARLFRLLGLHPGPDVTVPAAASIAGIAEAEARSLLAELTSAHLMFEHTPGRFTFHDLLRDYAAARSRAVDSDDERDAVARRMLNHYMRSALAADQRLSVHRDPITPDPPEPGVTAQCPADLTDALRWFRDEHGVLLAVLGQADVARFAGVTWQLAWTMVTYLDRQAHWQDLATTSDIALAAAERMADADKSALAHRLLAHAFMRLGRFDDADKQLWCGLELLRACGDGVGQARLLLTLSDLWVAQQHHEEGLDYARRALQLYRAAGHLAGQADAGNTVGWCYALLGDHRQAIVHCEEALRLHRHLGSGIVQATAWDSLGYAHEHLGDHSTAIACYTRALDLFQDLGDRYSEAQTLAHLGDTHAAAGHPDDARAAWLRATDILDDIAHPDAEEIRAKLETSHVLR